MAATASAAGEPTIRLDRAATGPADWDALVTADGSTDYPHTAHWTECAVRALPGAAALWLTARKGGRLVAGLAAVQQTAGRIPLARRRLDCSVDGTSSGPLVAADLAPVEQEALVRALLGSYRSLRPGLLGAVTLALGPDRERRWGPLVAGLEGWTRHASPTAVIDLAGGAETVERDRLAMTKRNERNRGLRRGAQVTASREASDLAAYYPLYTAAAAHWGVRPTPLAFLVELLADPGERVFFTCVRLDGRVIGGHLNLHLGDRVFAWNGVSDPSCARTHFPATLCFWGDIVEACRRGARWLDMGASGGHASLEGFKRYFGAELQERGYYVDEGAALRLARTITGRAGSGGPKRAPVRRWHDGRTGVPLKGGDA